MNKKLLIFLSVIIGSFAIFVTIVCVGFFSIKNNPIDRIAMTYIWNKPEITDEIGEIVHVGRNIVEKSEKTDLYMKLPYGVETKDDHFIVYVVLRKDNETWVAVDYEIVE